MKKCIYVIVICILLPYSSSSTFSHATNRCQSVALKQHSLSYCEMISDPSRYDGKDVTIQASYRYEFETMELFCLGCRDRGKTWVIFDKDLSKQDQNELAKAPKGSGIINAMFTGTFQSSNGMYGHLGGYKFQFIVKSISKVEVVSDVALNPLDPAFQKSEVKVKACRD